MPDLTTTVLTMTLTGIAADARRSGELVTIVRRLLSVLSMFAGAVVGTLLALHTRLAWALVPAALALGGVVLVACLSSRRAAAWQTYSA